MPIGVLTMPTSLLPTFSAIRTECVVNDGEMYGDNFKEDGGVPWVGPFIGPTGDFPVQPSPLVTSC